MRNLERESGEEIENSSGCQGAETPRSSHLQSLPLWKIRRSDISEMDPTQRSASGERGGNVPGFIYQVLLTPFPQCSMFLTIPRHFILRGAPDTPYEGGEYWGQLIFPGDYPFKPP